MENRTLLGYRPFFMEAKQMNVERRGLVSEDRERWNQ